MCARLKCVRACKRARERAGRILGVVAQALSPSPAKWHSWRLCITVLWVAPCQTYLRGGVPVAQWGEGLPFRLSPYGSHPRPIPVCIPVLLAATSWIKHKENAKITYFEIIICIIIDRKAKVNITFFNLDSNVVRVGASLRSWGSLFLLFVPDSSFSMICLDSLNN